MVADIACQKNVTQIPESQGTNFNRLLKTVTVYSNFDKKITENFTYNTTGDLIESKKITRTGNIVDLVTITFYRNSAGIADSILWNGKNADTLNFQAKTKLYYDAAGKLLYSIFLIYPLNTNSTPYKDSSVYFYSGNGQVRRDDYNTGYGSRLRQLFYQYDIAGNMSSVRIEISTGISDVFNFSYDNKENTLPNNLSLYFSFAPLYFYDYKSINNTTEIDYGGWSTNQNFQYQYTTNNKPLTRKMYSPSSYLSEETLFYYD